MLPRPVAICSSVAPVCAGLEGMAVWPEGVMVQAGTAGLLSKLLCLC